MGGGIDFILSVNRHGKSGVIPVKDQLSVTVMVAISVSV